MARFAGEYHDCGGDVGGIKHDHYLAGCFLRCRRRAFLRSASRSFMASAKSSFIPGLSVNMPIVRRQSLSRLLPIFPGLHARPPLTILRTAFQWRKSRLPRHCESPASLWPILPYGEVASAGQNDGGQRPSLVGKQRLQIVLGHVGSSIHKSRCRSAHVADAPEVAHLLPQPTERLGCQLVGGGYRRDPMYIHDTQAGAFQDRPEGLLATPVRAASCSFPLLASRPCSCKAPGRP